MRDRDRKAAPNYTNAVLVMGFVNLMWSLLLIWATLGLPAALVAAVFVDYLIMRLDRYRRRVAKSPSRPPSPGG
ncbi:histidinol phosphate aminotransferase [Marimonas arenosa]|uniref:Histidinol phosphate aminotransferase n=1 Tax=Marimonas arenosa TaxID=1795305 RepID=A0AAE4B5T5_9RHOB|nr:histidinol phosphate aminotransferase [Marimonas arenosa]MDQ2092343.1 histidinol phosphate aminotransferase [Marimonas arenosa]